MYGALDPFGVSFKFLAGLIIHVSRASGEIIN
jgi:hypothetical protein